jgi:transferase hexapeptide repeat containing protein
MFLATINKLLKKGVYFFKQKLWYLLNKPFFKHLGEGSFIDTPLKITKKYIECEKKVYIWRFCRIEGVSQYNKQQYTPRIIFEEGVTIQQFLHLTCANQIKIGKNTAIAAFVTITDIHHPYEDIFIPIEQQDIEVSEIFIGENSKIYNNVVILPGTKLGKHTTVGANSVVSGIFPDYCVIVGAPAKIVKRYCFEQQKWRKTDNKGNFIE